MKLRNPFLIQTAALLGATVIKRLHGTLDLRVALDEGSWDPRTHPRHGRCIYAFWHDTMLLPAALRGHCHILISQHADGELITKLIQHFGFCVVRGSSTRGGATALRELIRISEKRHLVVTPDGPRGPRRKLQPGAVFLASQTGLPIVPVGVGYGNAWRAKSWDRFAIPKPFSQARLVFGAAIPVPEKLERRDLVKYVERVQERMQDVGDRAERWATGSAQPAPIPAPLPYAKSA